MPASIIDYRYIYFSIVSQFAGIYGDVVASKLAKCLFFHFFVQVDCSFDAVCFLLIGTSWIDQEHSIFLSFFLAFFFCPGMT